MLRGQMSLVGPRQPLLAEVGRYEWLYRRHLSIKPGITCLWTISGRNQITFKQWIGNGQGLRRPLVALSGHQDAGQDRACGTLQQGCELSLHSAMNG